MKPGRAEISQDAALLRRDGWLAGTTPDFQAAVLAQCRWQCFEAGETITHGGDTSGGMVAIVRGAVSITPSIGTPDAPMIHIATAPFWYGSNPLIRGTPRNVSVVARGPTLVAQLPQHALESHLGENPRDWQFIALQLTEINTLVSQIAVDLLIRDSRQRCVAVLLRVAGCRPGDAAIVEAAVTQDELAAMANMSRQTIGPILRGLAEAGLIEVGYRVVTLQDPAGLRAIING